MSTKIGPAKDALVEAVGEDFSSFVEKLDELKTVAEELKAVCAGINGSSSFWNGCSLRLADEMKAVEKAKLEVLAKLTEKVVKPERPEVVTTVDETKLDEVKAAKTLNTGV